MFEKKEELSLIYPFVKKTSVLSLLQIPRKMNARKKVFFLFCCFEQIVVCITILGHLTEQPLHVLFRPALCRTLCTVHLYSQSPPVAPDKVADVWPPKSAL
jgi:hypothetical protein